MSTLITCANAANRPASPSNGDTLYQIDTKQIIVYDTNTWRVFGADDAEGYDLDGTNVMSASPAFHFDAGFINGVDATGNPSDGTSFTGQWISKVRGVTTVAQSTASSQPTWNASGENSKPYLDFDGTDFLDLTDRLYCNASFTILLIVKADANGTFGILSVDGSDDTPGASNFELGTDGVFRGYSSNGVLLFFSDAGQGYPGVHTFTSGKNYNSETRSIIYRKDASGGNHYIDGNNAGSNGSNANPNDIRFGRIGKLRDQGFDGKLYEVLIFNSKLTDADLNAWGAYVTTKYGAGGSGMEAQVSF